MLFSIRQSVIPQQPAAGHGGRQSIRITPLQLPIRCRSLFRHLLFLRSFRHLLLPGNDAYSGRRITADLLHRPVQRCAGMRFLRHEGSLLSRYKYSAALLNPAFGQSGLSLLHGRLHPPGPIPARLLQLPQMGHLLQINAPGSLQILSRHGHALPHRAGHTGRQIGRKPF